MFLDRMGDGISGPYRLVSQPVRSMSGHVPLLVAGTAAGPDLQWRPVGGVAVRVVEALTGGGVDDLPVHYLPLLVRAARAREPLNVGAVVEVGADDVHAAAIDLDAAVAGQRPALRGRDVIAAEKL